MAKYDWKQLEKEYLLNDYNTVSAFLKAKDIENNSYVRKVTKGWKEKKTQNTDKKMAKIIEKVTEKEIEKEVDINTRHLQLYDKFLNVLERSFNNSSEYYYIGMPDYDKLKKMVDILEKAQRGQRLAKGLDKDNDGSINQSLAEVIQRAYENKVGDK